jgi:integrase
MLILTGQRRSELAGMTWQSIDRGRAVWIIPSHRAKNAEPHVVHLSAQALAVLDTVPRIESKAGYVFSTKAEKPLSGWDQMKRRLDGLMAECAEAERGEPVSIAPWTLHDIRRSVAAGMQSLGVQREVTEKLLNHSSGSFAGIVGVYQVYAYENERRAALDAWGRRVMEIVSAKPA